MMLTGYKNLTESDKKLFDAFCDNYRAAQNSDTEIKFLAVKRAGICLRVFDFERSWLMRTSEYIDKN